MVGINYEQQPMHAPEYCGLDYSEARDEIKLVRSIVCRRRHFMSFRFTVVGRHVIVMRTAILYSYDTVTHRGCCRLLNPKHAAISAAIYTLNISILVVLLYSWRIGVNIKKYADLQDVYYGVQIAYFAIIGTQLFMIVLSVILLIGIYKPTLSESIQEDDGFGFCDCNVIRLMQ
ncbi:uncharacterized protein CBL_01413 [Carabus blaptoides fortunei]